MGSIKKNGGNSAEDICNKFEEYSKKYEEFNNQVNTYL
jgi:hypothetical protein